MSPSKTQIVSSLTLEMPLPRCPHRFRHPCPHQAQHTPPNTHPHPGTEHSTNSSTHWSTLPCSNGNANDSSKPATNWSPNPCTDASTFNSGPIPDAHARAHTDAHAFPDTDSNSDSNSLAASSTIAKTDSHTISFAHPCSLACAYTFANLCAYPEAHTDPYATSNYPRSISATHTCANCSHLKCTFAPSTTRSGAGPCQRPTRTVVIVTGNVASFSISTCLICGRLVPTLFLREFEEPTLVIRSEAQRDPPTNNFDWCLDSDFDKAIRRPITLFRCGKTFSEHAKDGHQQVCCCPHWSSPLTHPNLQWAFTYPDLVLPKYGN